MAAQSKYYTMDTECLPSENMKADRVVGGIYDLTAMLLYDLLIPEHKTKPGERIKPVAMAAAVIVSRESFDVLLKPISSVQF